LTDWGNTKIIGSSAGSISNRPVMPRQANQTTVRDGDSFCSAVTSAVSAATALADLAQCLPSLWNFHVWAGQQTHHRSHDGAAAVMNCCCTALATAFGKSLQLLAAVDPSALLQQVRSIEAQCSAAAAAAAVSCAGEDWSKACHFYTDFDCLAATAAPFASLLCI
jgi:hypothetical protein